MKRRSIFSVILAVLLITTMFSTTAFALTVPTIEWNQSGYPFLELSSTERQTSNGTLVFDGSAYSATNSAFKIRLEKKGAFGSWSTVGTLRTGESGPGSSYHPREGRNVQGKYFKSTWTGLSTSATYRIVLVRMDTEKWQKTTIRSARIDIR